MRHDYVSLHGGREWYRGRWALKLTVVVPVDELPTLKIGRKECVEYSYDPDPSRCYIRSDSEVLLAVIKSIAAAVERDVIATRHLNFVDVIICGAGDDFAMTNETRRHFEEFVRGRS